jgi:hypothetical protein
LIATANAPQGLFAIDKPEGDGIEFVDVPTTDYRSIRRAILDLDEFEGGAAIIPSPTRPIDAE